MHPLDGVSRTKLLRTNSASACATSQCCSEVCPEEIHITDNAIIPLKERVVDEYYDPVMMLVRKIRAPHRRLRKYCRAREVSMNYQIEIHLQAASPKLSPKSNSTATSTNLKSRVHLPRHTSRRGPSNN